MIFEFFKTISIKTNNALVKFPLLGRIACIYFDITSQITRFILFNNIVFIGIYSSIVYVISVHFLEIQDFFHNVHLTELNSVLDVFKNNLNFQVKFTFFFLINLLDIVLLNTILAETEIVSHYMKKKYNDQILKDRGYNSTSTSLRKLGMLLAGTCTAYTASQIADVKKFDVAAQEYGKSYKEYVLASNGKDLVPPEPLLKLEISETVKKIVNFTRKNN